jgi:pectate lyase
MTGGTSSGGSSGAAPRGGSTATGGTPGGGSGGVTTGGVTTGGSTSGGAAGASATGGATPGGAGTGGGAGSGGSTPSGGSAGVGGASGTAGIGGSGNGGSGGVGGSSGGSAGSGGKGGMAGTSGTGGLPTVPDNGCNVRLTDTPTGFASQGGGTVGGGKATPILVTTKEQLQMYLADNQPRVLYLMNDVDYRTTPRNVQVCADDTTCDNGSGMQVDNARVSATCDAGEHMATRTRNESRLTIASNKTLIGIGSGRGAAIRGASLLIGSSQQVILRNLRIYDVNPHLVEAGDGITLEESSHIWLDHLLIEQISDGFIDIGSADSTLDDYITLSYNHINGRTAYLCGGHHNFVNFVDNGHVTYHHNWFDNGGGRNPKIGHERSNVHLYNNYWLNITYFCITAQVDAEARVESNYFENALRPHWLQLDGNGTAGIAIDSGNVYTGTSNGNTNRDVGGSVFTVPYTYTKDTAALARTSVMNCSGPQPIR